jgi:hypothetical protein
MKAAEQVLLPLLLILLLLVSDGCGDLASMRVHLLTD